MKQGIKMAFWAVSILAVSTPLFAGPATFMREAGGKACLPNEKTYFGQDRVTPVACAPVGGPSFSFAVHDGGRLVWSGRLASSESEAYFEPTAEGNGEEVPGLIIRRDFDADPAGRAIFFGASSPVEFQTITSAAGASIELPVMNTIGAVLELPPEQRESKKMVGKYHVSIHFE